MPDDVKAAPVAAVAPAAAAPATPVGEPSSPSPAIASAPATTADGASSAAIASSPDAASNAAPELSPSLISTADTKLVPDGKAVEIKPDGSAGDKPADAATPATADAAAKKDAPAKADAKADKSDGSPADTAAPADKAPAKEPQAVKYEAFKVPDGIKLADKETTEFTGILDDGKLSHQERAQKLVDLYVREAKRFESDLKTQQKKAWTDFTESLKADFKSDPDLGGNRQDTTLGVAKAVIERFGGTPEQRSDLYAMLDHTGMGNHKGLVRVLNNIYETFIRESAPVPGNPPRSQRYGSRQDAFYGSDANGAG